MFSIDYVTPVGTLLYRFGEFAVRKYLSHLSEKKRLSSMQHTMLVGGTNNALQYLKGNPDKVLVPFWKAVSNLRLVTSEQLVSTNLTAIAVSDLVTHFNGTECLIVLKGLSRNPNVVGYSRVVKTVFVLVVFRYSKQIFVFIVSVIMKELNNKEAENKVKAAALVSAVGLAMSDPEQLKTLISNLSRRDQMILESIEFAQKVNDAFKANKPS